VTDTPRRTWPNLADWTVWKLSPDGADVALTGSVIATSLFGSVNIAALPGGCHVSLVVAGPGVAGKPDEGVS